MKIDKRSVLTVIGLLVVAAFFLPLPGGTATYTPASAQPSGYLHIVTGRVDRAAPWYGRGPDYFVEDGELYLHCQTTRHALILTTFVSSGISDTKDIIAFRIRHPELDDYWPDSKQVDGGVAWTTEKIAKKRLQDTGTNTPDSQQ